MLTLAPEASGPFWVDDLPATAYVAEIDDKGAALELDGAAVESALRRPDGTPAIDRAVRDIDATADTFAMPWGAESPFTVPGVYWVDAWIDGQRVNPDPIVVEAPDGWYTLQLAREDWRDCPVSDRAAYRLLQIAKRDVLAYAPALAEGAPLPEAYPQAQLMHARDIWNSGKVDPATGDLGEGSFALTPFPLDWMIQQILRPKRATPKVARYQENGA